ncbi:MAG: peptidase domain-containing ABC transporter [Magnetococcales bacterium]|nr:peptidase domain-containing ABC transporter [Magnetococcales bacterium]
MTTTGSSHSAVRCLVSIATHHGVSTSVERLVHEYALDATEPEAVTLVRMATELGLKAKKVTLTWDELTRLQGVYPLMVRLANGNSVVVAGVRQDREAVAVFDPLSNTTALFLVERDAFLSNWHGDAILLKRHYAWNDTRQPFGIRWFVPELLRQGKALRDVAVAAVVMIVLALAVPIFFQLVIDKVLVHHSEATLQILTGGIVLALLFNAVFSWLRQFLLLSATNKIDIRLATRTFGHLLSLPVDYFDASTSGVTVRHLQQVEKIRQFLTGRLLLTLLDSVGLFVFIPLLFFYSVKLTFVTLLIAVMIAMAIWVVIGPFRLGLRALYHAEAERQGFLVETIQGMKTVKASAIEPVKRRHWEQKSAQAVRMHYRVGKIAITAQALVQFLEQMLTVSVVYWGASDVFAKELSVGALVAFQMLAGRVVTPLVQIVSLVQEYQETALSVSMLATVMNHPSERPLGRAGLTPILRGRIELQQVTFRYATSTTPVLDRIQLTLPAGTLLGLVGRTGSGKSSLTKLIQGMYPIQEGLIRLDGVDIRELDLAFLRRQIGVVLQDNFLFRGSVRENIGVTKPDATLEEITHAAFLAGAIEFIERLPQGFDTLLEENAANLSGGQKQRIALARALLPKPPILILDEATSALDPESEAMVMENLASIASGRTVILVSHRLTTLTLCQAIAVMDNGRIIAMDTHTNLLETCGLYRQLWEKQLYRR